MSDADRRKWNERHAAAAGARGAAMPAWLDAHDAALPRDGRALDVACGGGRAALWARERGLAVTAVDISKVALDKLGAAAPDVDLVERDLEEDPRLPEGPFALVMCFRYRQASLWPAMRAALGPGGVLVAEVDGVRNLERHAQPSRRWLAEPDELCRLAAPLEILWHDEGWSEGRYTAKLVARRGNA